MLIHRNQRVFVKTAKLELRQVYFGSDADSLEHTTYQLEPMKHKQRRPRGPKSRSITLLAPLPAYYIHIYA